MTIVGKDFGNTTAWEFQINVCRIMWENDQSR